MFWDASALVPYLVAEPRSREMTGLFARDARVVIWWATPVECVSAMERGLRQGNLATADHREARRRLAALVESSLTVQPHANLRARAERLLAPHPLRAADALQLAAALAAVEEKPEGQGFVCLDGRLRAAARREGFDVLPAEVHPPLKKVRSGARRVTRAAAERR